MVHFLGRMYISQSAHMPLQTLLPPFPRVRRGRTRCMTCSLIVPEAERVQTILASRVARPSVPAAGDALDVPGGWPSRIFPFQPASFMLSRPRIPVVKSTLLI